ncbi:hypothetical protein MAHJHV54_48520 [Mycobacterium avium subsp. hominissuis]
MTTNIAPAFIDVYSINDDDDSDPDSIYYATANTIDELWGLLHDQVTVSVTRPGWPVWS